MTWRLLTDSDSSASRHMAVDEAVSVSVRTGNAPPTLRLYTWTRPALTIGYFQTLEKEVDLPYCRSRNIEVVRRITGGRAILHGPEEITYSFSAPFSAPFHQGLHASYVQVSQAFIKALDRVGLKVEMTCSRKSAARIDRNPVCFQSLSYAEVSVHGRKIIGSAQKRWPDGLLQQGSIPLVIDRDSLFNVLRFPSEETRATARLAADGTMAGLREFRADLSAAALEAAIRRGFEEQFGIRLETGRLTREEESLAITLNRERYNTSHWNTRR